VPIALPSQRIALLLFRTETRWPRLEWRDSGAMALLPAV